MDVIQTGTNIATVKIYELPKSTETNGRATLATNEQTNQSEALELTEVAEATQTALDAAQTANQSSQTALASAATANQAAQNADKARENIAGDLSQKSSMFTGAIMGKGVFRKDDTSIFNDSGYTIRVVFKTRENQDTTLEQCVYATSNSGYSPRVTLSEDGFIYANYVGSGISYTKKYTPNTLYEVIIVSSNADCRSYCNNTKYGPSNRADTYIPPTSLSIGAYLSKASPFLGKIVSAQIFNFPFSDDDAAASWNGGHPELWRAPDAWRNVPALTWPTSSQTPESGTWGSTTSDTQREDNVAVANGFSGNFQRFVSQTAPPAIYLITRNAASSPMIVEFEYRADGGLTAYDGYSGYSGFKTFPATTGEAKKAVVVTHAGFATSMRGGASSRQIEIRTLSIKTCECRIDLSPASLTPTVWKDISGQGNDIPYVPFDSNPAECKMAYENMGFPDTIIGTEAPAVIPNFIGQRYIDTTNKAAYTAYGTSSASDWK